jgi:predicted regulator of Ras-like GTPase activity (Roadblock/LC7/MglB family)
LEEILEALIKVQGIESALIVGKDGLVITFAGEMTNDADFIGASMADIFNTLEPIFSEKLKEGSINLALLEAELKKYFLCSINEVAFLVLIGEPKLNLGLIRLELNAAVEKLREVL